MFLKKKKNILFIEIAPWEVNIIEGLRSAKQFKIINYIKVTEVPDTNELLVKKIIDTIRESGIKTKLVYLVIYDPRFEAECINVPMVTKQEAGNLVKRQVKKKLETIFPNPASKKEIAAVNAKRAAYYYTDHQILGKKSLVYGVGPRVLIDETIHLLEKAEFQPLLISSYPIALNNILLFMEQDVKEGEKENKKKNKKEDGEKEKEFTSFLYISSHHIWLIISERKGEFFFSRDLLSVKSAENEKKLQIQEPVVIEKIDLVNDPFAYQNILMEVVRSFLYINQQTKGIISSMVVGSCRDLPENLLKDLNEKLQIPIKAFDPSGKINIVGKVDEEEFKPVFLPVILGLLVDAAFSLNLNFVPLKVRERKKQAAGAFALMLFLILFCVAFVFGYIGLNWAQENYRRALKAQEESIEPLKPAYEQNKQNEAERKLYEYHKSILGKIDKIDPLWRGVFYELSQFSSPKMSLSLLAINKVEKGEEGDNQPKKKKKAKKKEKGGAGGAVLEFRLNAVGTITADTSGEAQAVMDKFLNNLRESVYFREPKIINVILSPIKEGAAGVQLTFTLTSTIAH